MAPHSSTLAWKIPWMEEPGGLQSMGSLESDTTERLHFHFSLSCIGEGNGNPLQCSCLENPRDGGAWWAAVYGVSQSRTQLKRLSSSSSSSSSIVTSQGILWARILEPVAMPSSRGSSQPRDRTQVSILQADSSPSEPPGKPKNTGVCSRSLLQGIFPTQELNQGLLHYRWIIYQRS